MATYHFNGQVIHAPDDLPVEEVVKLASDEPAKEEVAEAPAPTPPQSETVQQQAPNGIPAQVWQFPNDPDQMQFNKDWVAASRTLYEHSEPKPAGEMSHKQLSDQEYAQYGLETMGWLPNTVALGYDAARVRNAPDEYKKAFMFLMDKYDTLDHSWAGTGRYAKATVTDPLNLASIAMLLPSLGTSSAGAQAAKITGKAALKEALKQGLILGADNAIISAGQSTMKQSIRVEGGGQESISGAEVAKDSAIGLAGGFALGMGGTLVAKGVKALREGKPVVEPRGKPVQPDLMPEATPVAKAAETPPVEPPTPVAEPVRTAEVVSKELDEAKARGATEPELQPLREELQQVVERGEVAPEVLPTVEPKVEPKAEPSITPTSNPVIDAIKRVGSDPSFRIFPTDRAGMDRNAAEAVDVLHSLNPAEVKRVVEEARRTALDRGEQHTFDTTFRNATENLLREVAEHERNGNIELRDKVLEILDSVRPVDTTRSSGLGAGLGARAGNLNTNEFRDVTTESILQEWGIDPARAKPEDITRAKNEFSKRLVDHIAAKEADTKVQQVTAKAQDAMDRGDFAEASKLGLERDTLKEQLLSSTSGNTPFLQQVGQWAKTAQRLAVEVMISNVFSTKTLVMNVLPSAIKMAMRPGLDALVTGAGRQQWRKAGAVYTAMFQAQGTALRAASLAWKYERGLLSGDMSKVFEDGRGPVIPQWAGGGIVRMFPRMVSATDEYMGQVLYRAYNAGESYMDLFEEAISRGKTDAEAHAYAKANMVDDAEAKAFSQAEAGDTLDALIQVGRNRGLSGDKLQDWVKLELDKNADLFQTATSQSGLDHKKDMLFQREFSGNGFPSKAAKKYEEIMNEFPALRLVGQLFFRTPVRVFEEGWRLTPGLNLIAPHFIRDLKGGGIGGQGGIAQVRAQGEAMLSIAFATSVATMYSQGMITGAGVNDNWKQKRSFGQGGFEPYTIYFGDPKNKDTYKITYRNYDPFAMPMKIMVNALDRFSLLQLRRAQGEYVGDDQKLALAHLSAAGYAVVQAFRDASLTQGFDEGIQLLGGLMDPENKENNLVRFMAQKLQNLVPSMVGKTQQAFGDGTMNDPASLEQYIRAKVNPSDPMVPNQYDVMGLPVKDPDPTAQLTGVDLRVGGRGKDTGDAKRDAVGKALNEITVYTGKNFIPPTDAGSWAPEQLKGWKGTDLRTTYMKDGKTTYYDRLNQFVAEGPLKDQLHALLVDHDLGSNGTPSSQPTLKVKMVQEAINKARQAAFGRMMMEETGVVMDKHYTSTMEEFKAQMGLRDVKIHPFE